MFSNKEREGINTLFCALSLYVAETQGLMHPITHNTFRHCRVRFCWTIFLETAELYIRKIICQSLRPGQEYFLNIFLDVAYEL